MTRGIAADQNKIGGAVIGQFMHGTNKLSPDATLESSDFLAGSSGFQLAGDGSAEFGDMTVRGTITGATLIGTLKTSATGNRIEVFDNAGLGYIRFYSNVASETPSEIYASTSGAQPYLELRGGYIAGTPSTVTFQQTSGRRSLNLWPGKPLAGTRGWLEIHSSPTEGRATLRNKELAPFYNVPGTTAGSNPSTFTGGAMAFSEAGPLLAMVGATTYAISDVNGHAVVTIDGGAFPAGTLAVAASAVQGWALAGIGAPAATQPRFLILDKDGSSATTIAFWTYDDTGAPVALADVGISYLAVGW